MEDLKEKFEGAIIGNIEPFLRGGDIADYRNEDKAAADCVKLCIQEQINMLEDMLIKDEDIETVNYSYGDALMFNGIIHDKLTELKAKI